MFFKELFDAVAVICFFSVSNEHQEQEITPRHSWLLASLNNADIDIQGH